MSYSPRSLIRTGTQAPVGAADGSAGMAQASMWLYATLDAGATVEAASYFNAARSQLAKGDVILSVMAQGGTPVLKAYVVTAVPASGDVVIARLTTTAG